MTQETKNDLLDGLKKFVLVAPAMAVIALLGSSVQVPVLAIPAGVSAWSAIAYFTTKGSAKTKRKAAIGWGALTAIFTTAGVLAS